MKVIVFLLLFTSFLFTPQIFSQDFAVGVKISTLGGGIEAVRSFSPNINARLGFSLFSLSFDGGVSSEDDYKFNAKLGLLTIAALADYFPFERGLRITGGLIVNLNNFKADIKPNKSYSVGGDVYSPDLLGTMSADISFNKVAPYIGIGFGNPTAGSKGLGFSFDIGTIYQGAPKAKLSASGLIEPSASHDQQEKLESNLSWFKWYPVLSFGLMYKF